MRFSLTLLVFLVAVNAQAASDCLSLFNAQDYEKAYFACSKESAKGDAGVQYALGMLYYYGKGTTQDYEKAYRYLSTASSQNYAQAQYYLARLYEKEEFSGKNTERYLHWLHKAAENQVGAAQYQLSYEYKAGKNTSPSTAQAAKWLNLAAQNGYPRAVAVFGVLTYKGEDGHVRDYGKALPYLRQAANQNWAEPQYYLADAYLHGNGMQKDVQQYLDWLTRSATNGYAHAQLVLALEYKEGGKLAKDAAASLKWLNASADQNYPQAHFVLGLVYYEGGLNQTKNDKLAFRHFERAANAGNVESMHKLAYLYYLGEGILRDFQQAEKWAKQASLLGQPYSPAILCNIYAGEYVNASKTEAYKWCYIAAHSSVEMGKGKAITDFVNRHSMEALEKKISSEEKSQSEENAKKIIATQQSYKAK